MKKLLIALVSVFVVTFQAQAADKPLKIGFVYVSPIGDAGWTFQHDLGRIGIEKEFGDRIETKYIESVAEGPDAERVIRKLASTGYGLIFATSFGFMNPTLKTAQRFPKVVFEHATGYKTSKNMGNYSPRFYEGRYLSGIAAGAKTKTNVIGYVGAFPIPEVVRGINAFALGARSVNPDVVVKVVWVNSWYDPGKESEAANSLITQNADVLTHHTDSIAIVKAAASKGKFSISYHSDMQKHGGQSQIGAVVHKWTKFYSEKVNEVLSGTWKSESKWLGIKEGMVDFYVTAPMDASVKSKIAKARAGIVDGSVHPFAGPIKNQQGKMMINEGASADDKALGSMNYFVEGVEGKL